MYFGDVVAFEKTSDDYSVFAWTQVGDDLQLNAQV